MTKEEKLQEAVAAAMDMRVKQKAYFKNRTTEALVASKAAEKKFDELAAKIAAPDLLG